MDIHKNARLTPQSRAELVRRVVHHGQSPKAVATAFGRLHQDRAQVGGAVASGRRGRAPGPLVAAAPPAQADAGGGGRAGRGAAPAALDRQGVAAELGVSPATVSRILQRLGLSRLRDLEPAAPVRRYERAHPGELIHIDIKKLGRFDRVGHRITGDRTGQCNQPRHRLGVRPRVRR